MVPCSGFVGLCVRAAEAPGTPVEPVFAGGNRCQWQMAGDEDWDT